MVSSVCDKNTRTLLRDITHCVTVWSGVQFRFFWVLFQKSVRLRDSKFGLALVIESSQVVRSFGVFKKIFLMSQSVSSFKQEIDGVLTERWLCTGLQNWPGRKTSRRRQRNSESAQSVQLQSDIWRGIWDWRRGENSSCSECSSEFTMQRMSDGRMTLMLVRFLHRRSRWMSWLWSLSRTMWKLKPPENKATSLLWVKFLLSVIAQWSDSFLRCGREASKFRHTKMKFVSVPYGVQKPFDSHLLIRSLSTRCQRRVLFSILSWEPFF